MTRVPICRRRALYLGVALAVLCMAAKGIAEDKGHEFFESRIRPVLVKHCYECHSAEAEEVSGSLLVDTAAGLRQGGDSGPALVAGKPDESLLLQALRYEGVEMPPAGRLPEATIADFEKWIQMGAPDPRAGEAPKVVRESIDIEDGRQYWAFQPVVAHSPPQIESHWPRSGIDHFLLVKLHEAGLEPSPDADRGTLARRLYYDLIGLPPTPTQLREFLADDSANAIEKLVDRLLDSPQFGVHWGRHWLDIARYADSNGGDFNATFHDAWKYRDYVVNAFNSDKPYDQFVREQIAGDLLPYQSPEQRTEQVVATGFLMAGTKMLSERDKEKLRMDVVDEQINTVGEAFMALTLGCARCHDHKFDPIPTQDYYALAGIFRSTSVLEGESQRYVSTWPRRELPADPEHVAALEKHQAATKQMEERLAKATNEAKQLQARLQDLQQNSLTADDSVATLTGDWKPSTYTPPFIGAGYVHDNRADKGSKSVTYTVKVPKSGTYDVLLSYTPGATRAANVPVSVRCADGEEVVTVDQTKKPEIKDMFTSLGRFRFDSDKPAAITISNRDTTGYVIADAVRLVEVDENGKPVQAETADPELEQVRKEVEQANQSVALFEKQLKDHKEQAPPPLPTAFAVAEHEEIGDCEICIRGEHRNRGPKVQRGFVQVAMVSPTPTIPAEQSGRHELAEWIASPDHPLTARVMVNRVWYHLMGEGIVASVDNFGKLGSPPTHPELLDYLASDFVDKGWSVKHIVRSIVLSRAYAMSSQHNEQAYEIDPENKLYWRANRRRLPAEAVRDSILAIAGNLDLQPGGSPVQGLGTLVTTNDAQPKEYSRQTTVKRSLYLPIIRNELPPILSVFDFADPDMVTGKRAVTNVPAQALLLMNSPFVMECAEQTAELLTRDGQSDSVQIITAAYERILSRTPTADELQQATNFLRTEGDAIEPARVARLVHVLLASTEFRFLN